MGREVIDARARINLLAFISTSEICRLTARNKCHNRTRALDREAIDTRYPDERNGQTIAGLNEFADYIEGLTPCLT